MSGKRGGGAGGGGGDGGGTSDGDAIGGRRGGAEADGRAKRRRKGGAGRGDGDEERLVGDEASASVEVKKLLRVLTSLSASDLKIQNAIVCVVPNTMVILKIYLNDETAQSFMIYYLPVLAGVEDD